jgi:hypothetical protein
MLQQQMLQQQPIADYQQVQSAASTIAVDLNDASLEATRVPPSEQSTSYTGIAAPVESLTNATEVASSTDQTTESSTITTDHCENANNTRAAPVPMPLSQFSPLRKNFDVSGYPESDGDDPTDGDFTSFLPGFMVHCDLL